MLRMTKRFCAFALVFLASAFSFGTVSVSGNLVNPATGNVSSRAFVRFWIRGCGGNAPRVTGTGIVLPSYTDFTPTAGAISGTLYDSLTEISCGGSVGATWYGVVAYYDGKPGPEVPYNVTGGSFNLNNATPNTTNPVVAAPTGDSTYARLDAGNQPFTGGIQATYFKSGTTNSAASGLLRGASSDQICLRNNGHTADVCQALDSSDRWNLGSSSNIQSGTVLTGTIQGKDGIAVLGNGGDLTLNGGASTCCGGRGGSVNINGGTGGVGGSINLTASGVQGITLNSATQLNQVALQFKETTAPSAAAGNEVCYGDSTAHAIKCSYNNGSFFTLAAPTLTLKKGSGTGNYTSASTTYVRVDSTNLAYTVTIPAGWKLSVSASGSGGTVTAAVSYNIALADGSADNTGILAELQGQTSGASVPIPFALNYVITGDGASHTINLQYKTSAGADSVLIHNATATLTPQMTFNLSPSN